MSASLTLKSIPDEMMEKFRKIAVENHRSLTGEIMYRLKKSLEENTPSTSVLREEAEIMADEWEKIGGNWRSHKSTEEELEELYSSRSMGREADVTW